MPNRYNVGAKIDIGHGRENNEDFFQFKELDEDNLLCIIADGTGSRRDHPQPAAIVILDIMECIENFFQEREELFMEDPAYFMKLAMLNANRVLGGFKMGNEEFFSGYSASVTCCLLSNNNSIYIAHSGNTRAYMIRNGKMRQLTHDHTKAAELLEEGTIDAETYYIHPDRLKMTSGLGMLLNPEIQIVSGSIKDRDIIVMTTDGIHYAIRPEIITDIILNSQNIDDACDNLIAGQRSTNYPDNAGVGIIIKNVATE